MVTILGKPPYHFDEVHLPRAYISDREELRSLLSLLQKKHSLTYRDISRLTARGRSEQPRENFISMWNMGFNIGIYPAGRSIGIVDLGVVDHLRLSDEEWDDFIIERAWRYGPYFATIYYYTTQNLSTEELGHKLFAKVTKGTLDQLHPQTRIAHAWGHLKREGRRFKITQTGLEFWEKIKNKDVVFVSAKKDLEQNTSKLHVLYGILQLASENPPVRPFLQEKVPYQVNIDDIVSYLNRDKRNTYTTNDIRRIVNELKEIGVPLEYDETSVTIKKDIYFDLRPEEYLRARLHILDKIFEYVKPSKHMVKPDISDALAKIRKHRWVVVTTTGTSQEYSFLKDDAAFISYDELLAVEPKLPDLAIEAIFFPPNWSPIYHEMLTGTIHAFVHAGGVVVAHGTRGGRVGTNRTLMNWTPEDFNKLVFVESGPYFTFATEVESVYCHKIYGEEIERGRYRVVAGDYGLGKFIFCAPAPSRETLSVLVKKYFPPSGIAKIDREKPHWKYREFAHLIRLPNVRDERHVYPWLGKALRDLFGFTLSNVIYGWKGKGHVISGATDLLTVRPYLTCWEVMNYSTETIATSSQKVSENAKHRKFMGIWLNTIIALIEDKMKSGPVSGDRLMREVLSILPRDGRYKHHSMPPSVDADARIVREIFEAIMDEFLERNQLKSSDLSRVDAKLILDLAKNYQSQIRDSLVVACTIGPASSDSEGLKNGSRPTAVVEKVSLFTYRDLYELIVRTEGMNRKKAILEVISKQNGEVCRDVAKLRAIVI